MRFGPLPRIITFLRSRRRGFVFRFVARIHVGREAFKFGGAGIDAVEDSANAQLLAGFANGHRLDGQAFGNLAVAQAIALQLAKFSGGEGIQRTACKAFSRPPLRQICCRNQRSMLVISCTCSTV